MELILIGFGDTVTDLRPATPQSSFFDEDFNKKHNAKMLPAWSWPGHSAWAPIQDLASTFPILRGLRRVLGGARSAACV